MSTTTEAIDLVDDLVKAKIPKETAKQLVAYADKQKDKAIGLQWAAIAILATGLFTIFGILYQMSQKMATKEDLKKLGIGIGENRKLLIQLIQKR